MYRDAFPDIQFTFEDIIARGDKVVVRWTTRGSHQRELFGTAPTGKQIDVTGIGIAQIVNGRIRVSHSEVNMLSLTQQIGAVPDFG
jgi:predicted ester cyclase